MTSLEAALFESNRARVGRVKRLGTLGLALLLLLASAIWAILIWEPYIMPIRNVVVQGVASTGSAAELQKQVRSRLTQGMLFTDLNNVHDAVIELPWVERAQVRRVWPDKLVINVGSFEPIAQWNDNGLVTADGVIYHPAQSSIPEGLVRFYADDARVQDVIHFYNKWGEKLVAAGQIVDSVVLDGRGNWTFYVGDGVELVLGANDIDKRLNRFLKVANELDMVGNIARVDLRYSNGFALKWKSPSSLMANQP